MGRVLTAVRHCQELFGLPSSAMPSPMSGLGCGSRSESQKNRVKWAPFHIAVCEMPLAQQLPPRERGEGRVRPPDWT